MLIGYARGSTEDQNLVLQRDALERIGRAGSFLACLAGSRGGLGDFAIAANMGGVAG